MFFPDKCVVSSLDCKWLRPISSLSPSYTNTSQLLHIHNKKETRIILILKKILYYILLRLTELFWKNEKLHFLNNNLFGFGQQLQEGNARYPRLKPNVANTYLNIIIIIPSHTYNNWGKP